MGAVLVLRQHSVAALLSLQPRHEDTVQLR